MATSQGFLRGMLLVKMMKSVTTDLVLQIFNAPVVMGKIGLLLECHHKLR